MKDFSASRRINLSRRSSLGGIIFRVDVMKHSFSKHFKSAVSGLLILSFLVAGIISPFGHKEAEAQPFVPTGDIVHLPLHVEEVTKDFALDAVAWQIAKIAIQQMTQSIVNWINSGFEGGPAFLQNPEQFFLGIADEIAGGFIESIGLGFLCEPFSLDLRISLALEYGQGSSYFHRARCTLSDVIENIEGFTQGDFSQGGWDGWFQITQRPGNNPYGSYLLARAEIGARINTSQGRQGIELNWGSGFFSYKDENGNIVTPGNLIEDQLSHVMGSGIRQLELADEFNEIISALMNQLLIQGLGAVSGGGGGGGGFSSLSNCTGGSCGGGTVDGPATFNRQSGDTGGFSVPQSGSADGGGSGQTQARNIALGLRDWVSQSGTYFDERTYPAENAVDGNDEGVLASNPAMAITTLRRQPWWEIDLSAGQNRVEPKSIDQIHIFPQRGGGFTLEETFGDARLFISQTRFRGDFDARDERTWPDDVIFFELDGGGQQKVVQVNASGRYVRIQRLNNSVDRRLHLAEVKVFENIPPQISLQGARSITLNTGEVLRLSGNNALTLTAGDLVISPEATATDTQSRSNQLTITRIVERVSDGTTFTPPLTIDTATAETYRIIYTATDPAGAQSTAVRTIIVEEPQP